VRVGGLARECVRHAVSSREEPGGGPGHAEPLCRAPVSGSWMKPVESGSISGRARLGFADFTNRWSACPRSGGAFALPFTVLNSGPKNVERGGGQGHLEPTVQFGNTLDRSQLVLQIRWHGGAETQTHRSLDVLLAPL